MTVDEQKTERLLQDIPNEKSTSWNEELKNFVFIVRGPLWDRKVVKLNERQIKILYRQKQANEVWFTNCSVLLQIVATYLFARS